MAAQNADIARTFRRMADLLEIEDANPFRVRAYRRAAETLDDLAEPVARLLARGADLSDLPGVGEDLAGKIAEISRTGRLAALEAVEARTPSALAQLGTIPGLGPRRIRALHERLGVVTAADLKQACLDGRVRRIPHFGRAFEARLLTALRGGAAAAARRRLAEAEDDAHSLQARLERAPGVARVVVAGSFRRRQETVGDLDLVVAAPNGTAVGDALAAFEEVATVMAKGPTRTSVVLASGLQVDLRVVQPDSFGAALVYFTGSRSHTIALRERAKAWGLKLNEYGVFRGDTRIAGRTEEDVYEALGLAFIPPELREDRGEIAAAAQGRLPRLIALSDIRGDLHVHTDASDGRESLDAMVLAARARGYGYVAITDHSAHARVAHGLDVTRLSAQLDAIDRLNARLQGIAALKASEVDILKDGRLDLPDEALARLDLVVAAIHSDFGLSRGEQTRRLLRAMDHPRVSIIAHPTGRLLGAREGYAVDMDAVIAHARNRGCALEINAHPSRLDLNDIQARAAKSAGARLSIGSDAHTSLGLGHMRLGVDQARRAWIEPQNTLNTRSWPELKALIAR